MSTKTKTVNEDDGCGYSNPFKTVGRMTLTEAVQETYEHHKKALVTAKPNNKPPKKLIKTAKKSNTKASLTGSGRPSTLMWKDCVYPQTAVPNLKMVIPRVCH